MAIEDKMYKMIEKKIDQTLKEGTGRAIVDENKVKVVAKMLTELCTDKAEPESLMNQYMANIKNICKS